MFSLGLFVMMWEKYELLTSFYLSELYQHCIHCLHNYYLVTDIRTKYLGVKYIPNVIYFFFNEVE